MEDQRESYTCGHSDDIVSYIYGEIASNDRAEFESHLSGCTSCTDEFALISDARFSMFEWRKEEFAHLPTPEILIPFREPTDVHIGFFGAIGEMVRNAGLLAQASAAVVVFSIAVSIAIAVMSPGETSVVGSDTAEIPGPIVNPPAVIESRLVASEIENEETPVRDSVVVAPRNERALNRPSVKRIARRSAKPQALRTPSPLLSRAPVLNSFEVKEDRSLRLADLLEEAGG